MQTHNNSTSFLETNFLSQLMQKKAFVKPDSTWQIMLFASKKTKKEISGRKVTQLFYTLKYYQSTENYVKTVFDQIFEFVAKSLNFYPVECVNVERSSPENNGWKGMYCTKSSLSFFWLQKLLLHSFLRIRVFPISISGDI